MLLSSHNICIEDFYISSSTLYVLPSGTENYVTASGAIASDILSGYVYKDNVCSPDSALMLGMDIKDFHFLLGLIGTIFGGIFMFFTTQIFMMVGGKK